MELEFGDRHLAVNQNSTRYAKHTDIYLLSYLLVHTSKLIGLGIMYLGNEAFNSFHPSAFELK